MKKARIKFFQHFCMLVLLFNVSIAGAQMRVTASNYKSMSGIDTEGTSDEGGGLNVGWIDNNDWLQYQLQIPVTGDYQISVRAASLNGGGVLKISDGGANTFGTMSISKTNGWQTWQTIPGTTISLTQGTVTLRLTATTGGFNLNWFELKLISPVDNKAPVKPEILNSSASIHDIEISWSKSTDEGSALQGYKILNGTSLLASSTDTVLKLSKLAPGKEYSLKVFAYDLAGNHSDTSSITLSTKMPDWELIWSDEFDGAAVNTSKWNLSTGPNNANNEKQYYNPGNASIVDGKLVITAKIEAMGGMPYTSAKLTSYNKGDWRYGRIDVKAKLPASGGTWPAIWMMPTESKYGAWPNSGEIDIMEHVGNNLGWVFSTVHTGAYNHTKGTQKGGGKTLNDASTAFHEYSVEWYPDHMDFYYDNVHAFTFKNDYKTYMEWPYDQKFYLILNVAMGGDLGGVVNLNHKWPSTMEVDYVRVYDLKLGQNDSIAPSEPSNLKATPASTKMTLAWTPATDNEYIKMYNVFLDGEKIDSTSNASVVVYKLEPESEHVFGIQAVDFGGNVSDTVFITASTTALTGVAIPAIIQAESYINMQGVQTETTTDAGGGLNVGWIKTGDWMQYAIDVKTAGTYYLAARTASQSSAGSIQLLDVNNSVLTTVASKATGGWQVWKTYVSGAFQLSTGIQLVTVKAATGGFNLNWIDITDNPSKYTGIDAITAISEFSVYPNPSDGNQIYVLTNNKLKDLTVSVTNLNGQLLYSRQLRNVNGSFSLNNLNLKSGMYFLQINTPQSVNSLKLIVE